MNKYELMYIIDVALEDEPRKALIDRISALITDNGGEVEKIDEWGKRRLAYPINYKNEGYYLLVNFTAKPDLPREIERVLQINENVLRYLIIRLEEKHTSVKPRAVPLRPVYGRPPEVVPGDDGQPTEAIPQAAAPTPAAETAPAADAAAPEAVPVEVAVAEEPVAAPQSAAPEAAEAEAEAPETTEA